MSLNQWGELPSNYGSDNRTSFMFRVWYDAFCMSLGFGDVIRASACLNALELYTKSEFETAIWFAAFDILVDYYQGRVNDVGSPSEN